VLLERCGFAAELVQNAEYLGIEALLGWGKESAQAQLVALLIGKAGVLIWERIRDDAMVSETI
jgi:hypothetical protein